MSVIYQKQMKAKHLERLAKILAAIKKLVLTLQMQSTSLS